VTRHLFCLSDLGPEGLIRILDVSDRLQAERGRVSTAPLCGKSVALLFEKASTRTRVSLEVAVYELGGHPLVISSAGSQMGRGEPLADTARVLSRMVHAATFRTSTEARLRELAEASTIPVLNALTDTGHPMQLLADLQTVRRVRGALSGLRYAWIGDGNNMANSWIEAAGLLRLTLTLAVPAGYDPDAEQVTLARERGAEVTIVRDPREAAARADVISTDVFTSMGREEEQAARLQAFSGMRVTQELLAHAAKDIVVLHCLPAHRGEEIDAEVIDGPRSFVWDQAEARLHTAKAALLWALGIDG
jgi:ornithine carbamoyltransferase